MTLRLLQVTGSLGGVFRLLRVSGTATYGSLSRLRLLAVGGAITFASPARLRLLKVSGQVAPAVVAPVLAAIPDQAVDPAAQVTITAAVTNGVTPDSYSFSAPGVVFSVNGNTATFSPPGTPTGGTLSVTVTATASGHVSAPVTANFLIRPSFIFNLSSQGALVGSSPPYQAQ